MNKRAFTLIEMLTSLGIAGLLAALLIGGLSKVRESAMNSKCISNLRQVGAGLLLFAQDHDGKVIGRNHAVEFKDDGTSTYSHWYRRLGREGYVQSSNQYGDSEIFYCPSYRPNGPNDSRVKNPLAVQNRYAMRSWVPAGGGWVLNDENQLLPMSAIERPADFFLVVDSIQPSQDMQAYSVTQGATDWRIHLRHNKKAHAVFADGHVEAKEREYFAELHTRQFYGGHTDGRPFMLWPEAP